MVLSRDQIINRYWQGEDLVSDSPLDANVTDVYQPNGVDLTIAKLERFTSTGKLQRDGKELPETREVDPDLRGRKWFLREGAYLITFNEIVSLPNNVMAYLRPRSTLLRIGAALHTAVWDAGYTGKGQSLLTVHNPFGVTIEQDARIGQLVFHFLDQSVEDGYDGSYQLEGIDAVDLLEESWGPDPEWGQDPNWCDGCNPDNCCGCGGDWTPPEEVCIDGCDHGDCSCTPNPYRTEGVPSTYNYRIDPTQERVDRYFNYLTKRLEEVKW